jgi:DNA helicase HerA-like ATPase
MPKGKGLEFAYLLNPENGRRTGEFLNFSLPQLRNHVLLAGGSGSGKTHFAKALIEEIILKQIPTILIDSQGDLLWLTRPTAQIKKRLSVLPKQVFTPNSAEGTPFVIAPVRFKKGEINRLLIRYWIRSILRTVGYDLRPGQTSPQEYHLVNVSEAIVSRSGDLSLELLFESASKERRNWIIDQTVPITDDDSTDLVSRLGALLGIDRPLYVGKPFSLRELTASKKGGLWIIYLAHLAIETRQLVLNWLCDSTYQWMMSEMSPMTVGNPNLVIFIDEAADYVSDTNRFEHRQSLFRLLNQGRKYGVGLILAVQTPRGLPPEVLNNCAVKVFGAIDDPGDLRYVTNVTGQTRGELKHLQDRSWKYAFVASIPGTPKALFCKSRDLLTRKGKPLPLGSAGMDRILKLLR